MDNFKIRSWIYYSSATLFCCSIFPAGLHFFGLADDLPFWFWFDISFYIFITVIPLSILLNNVHFYFKEMPLSFVPNKSLVVYVYIAYVLYFLFWFGESSIGEDWYIAIFMALIPVIPFCILNYYYAPDREESISKKEDA